MSEVTVIKLCRALKRLHQAVDREMGDTDDDSELVKAMGNAALLLRETLGENWGDISPENAKG